MTGDQAADCLNARNTVIRSQQAVTGFASALAVAIAANRPQNQIDAARGLLASAQANLDANQATATALCTPL